MYKACEVADLLHCPGSAEIYADVHPVQQQRNGTNCGLFALAYAVSLAYGEDPGKVRYDESKMREHLLSCLRNNTLLPFPNKEGYRSTTFRSTKRRNIELFCVCGGNGGMRGMQ